MIEYINISGREYFNLSYKERKAKTYCIEYHNRSIYWKVNDKLHREDGPALRSFDGICYWWLNDKLYTFEEWLEKTPISDEEKILLKLKYS